MHYTVVRFFGDALSPEAARERFAKEGWAVHAHRRTDGFSLSVAKDDDLEVHWSKLTLLFESQEFASASEAMTIEVDLLFEFMESRGVIQEVRPPVELLVLLAAHKCGLCVSISAVDDEPADYGGPNS